MNNKHIFWRKCAVIFLRLTALVAPYQSVHADISPRLSDSSGRAIFSPPAQDFLRKQFPNYTGYPTPHGCEFEKTEKVEAGSETVPLTTTIRVDLDAQNFEMQIDRTAGQETKSMKIINTVGNEMHSYQKRIFIDGQEIVPERPISSEDNVSWGFSAGRANAVCVALKTFKFQ